jgi:hypothetical protein
MMCYQQSLLAKLGQKPYHDPCRMPAFLSRIAQYAFHNKLGYVNCKGVLEYCDVLIVALTNQDRFPWQMASDKGMHVAVGSAVWKA